LTKTAIWSIPISVAIVGLVVSIGNKLYLLIQERGDMNIEKMLDAKINGQTRRIDAENLKRDAEYKEQQAKRDAEFREALDALRLMNVRQSVLESKQDINRIIV
jgi:N-acetyl-gamma-glutamylphosphate reductase